MSDPELYNQWLQARTTPWQRLRDSMTGKHRDRNLEQARDVLQGYRALASDVSLARREAPGTLLHRTAESLYAQTHSAIHKQRMAPLAELWYLFAYALPLAVRRLRGDITMTTVLFITTTLGGYLLVFNWRDTADLFMSPEMMLMVQNQTLWTDDLLNVVPSSMLSYNLMSNNISVALTAFALGLLYGIGTFYIVALNGLMLGAVFGYTVQFDMGLPLFRFIVAHGLVELSVIVLAGAAGLTLGRALARPGAQGRLHCLSSAAIDAGALAAVCVPFLIGSGLIEGYVSPNDGFGLTSRIVIGVSWFLFLLAVLHGGLFQFVDQTLRSRRN